VIIPKSLKFGEQDDSHVEFQISKPPKINNRIVEIVHNPE
jgi:hypothetical protein